LRLSHPAGDGLAAAGNHHSIGHQRLNQSRSKRIARMIAVARKWLVHTDRDPRTRRQLDFRR
jgi:hypothetical protein